MWCIEIFYLFILYVRISLRKQHEMTIQQVVTSVFLGMYALINHQTHPTGTLL